MNTVVKKVVRRCFRSVGYDVVEFPMSYDVPLRDHLMQLFDRLSINCVLDVGAHFGEFGAFLRDSGYRGRILSFEPVPESFTLLQKRCRGDHDWNAIELALGAEETNLPINVTKASNFSSFLVPNQYCSEEFGAGGRVEHTQMVRVTPLDAIFEQCIQGLAGPSVFLKMDTQGYDLHVLEGARHSLSYVRALESEISVKSIYDGMTEYHEAVTRIGKLGFELSGLFPVSHDHLMRVVELNCVMVRTPDCIA